MKSIKICFNLNGEDVNVEVSPKQTLLELLRREFKLTAAKEGCGKGECGACTVLLNSTPINSCLKLSASLLPSDKVETIEGLQEDSLIKDINQAYLEEGSVQCGFCIPGMVMSSYNLLSHNPNPSEAEIKHALSGNICRCTGYRKIEAGVKNASAKRRKTNESRN